MTRHAIGIALIAAAALVAFAVNSLLCRLALQQDALDAASFTAVRLAAGAGFLVPIAVLGRGDGRALAGDWIAAGLLLTYALGFAWAYRDLGAGTGALILFVAVQATMIGWGVRGGERLSAVGWTGMALAVAGLVVLTAPGLRAPTPRGSLSMVLAGVAWGVYSLRGRYTVSPLAATAGNFARATAPMVMLLILAAGLAGYRPRVTPEGLLYAAVSGALASGAGYVAWYAALKHLSATSAASLQLVVPVLAAAGGVLLLAEDPGWRQIVSAVMILGGVRAALAGQRP